MKRADIEWCQDLYRSLAEGGIWGVPRSGLLFTKQDGKLVLTDKMPLFTEMPVSAVELKEYQQDEYNLVKRHFEAAGIPVEEAS